MRIIFFLIFICLVNLSFAQLPIFPDKLEKGDTLIIESEKLRCHSWPIKIQEKIYVLNDSFYMVDHYIQMTDSIMYLKSESFKSNRREARQFLKVHGSSQTFEFVGIEPTPIDSLDRLPMGVIQLTHPIFFKVDTQSFKMKDFSLVNSFCVDVMQGKRPEHFNLEYGVFTLFTISIKNVSDKHCFAEEQRIRGWYQIRKE